jgi:deoxyhypusine synthase
MNKKADFLRQKVQHIRIADMNVCGMIDAMGHTAFQARNLSRAAHLYQKMLEDRDCTVIFCLAGSLVSAGMKSVIVDLIKNRMIDAIVSNGANIVDQDFFEALGFSHYQGAPTLDDNQLRELAIDRIYDTLINEDELRICDNTILEIANSLKPGAYSSREFIEAMAQYLISHQKGEDSIVRQAYENQVPIFVPAFSDCSAGFGLVMHQEQRRDSHIQIDSVKDFRELTQLKIHAKETGLLMMGGGVPKNFAQDIVVAAEMLKEEAPMHKYAIQVTVADERDGALSGSTLKEACSWGKVDTTYEQMVFCEATVAFPMIAAYAYHKGAWKTRTARRCAALFATKDGSCCV